MGKLKMLGVLILILSATITTITAQIDASESGVTGELIDDIEPYEGSIGPDSAFYGLKIAFESFDEAFTLNEGKKLEKRIDHARLRIAETKSELNRNRTEAAERVLERYRENIDSVNESISKLAGNDSGILEAQKSIMKYQYVLELLLKAHPDNRELERSHRSSLYLGEQFASRTELDLERELTEDRRIILREVKREREKTEIKANIFGNRALVEVKVKFDSGSTDRDAIAQEIVTRLRLNRDNISRLLGSEEEEEEEKPQEKLDAKAEIEYGISHVEAEYTFLLNTTNETEIVEGTYQKLLVLSLSDVRDALKIPIEEEEETEKDAATEIKAEIMGDRAQVEVQVKFASRNTERDAIAQEIVARLRLSRDNISRLLRIEDEEEAEFKENLKAEAEIEYGISHVEADYTFPLDTKNRTEIVEAIHAKLSALTVSDIRNSLNVDVRGSDGDVGTSREDERRESEKEDEGG